MAPEEPRDVIWMRPEHAAHPRLAELLAPASQAQPSPTEAAAEPPGRYRDILARILSGLLVPDLAGVDH